MTFKHLIVEDTEGQPLRERGPACHLGVPCARLPCLDLIPHHSLSTLALDGVRAGSVRGGGQGSGRGSSGPSPLKGKGACTAGQGGVALALVLKGRRVKRKGRHFQANEMVRPES